MKNPIHPKEEEILRILKEIRTTEYSAIQSVDLLLDYGFRLAQYISFTGEAMSEAKQLLHNAKRDGFDRLEDKFKRGSFKLGPMLQKDYVADCAGSESSYYELCERANRACTHTLDLCRTAVSALKVENQVQNYSNSRSY
jgi:hypothetical protein